MDKREIEKTPKRVLIAMLAELGIGTAEWRAAASKADLVRELVKARPPAGARVPLSETMGLMDGTVELARDLRLLADRLTMAHGEWRSGKRTASARMIVAMFQGHEAVRGRFLALLERMERVGVMGSVSDPYKSILNEE